jgi:hypothetical protein
MSLNSREFWAPAFGYTEEADALNGYHIRRVRRETLYKAKDLTGLHILAEWVADGREVATLRLNDLRIQTSLRYPTMPCVIITTMAPPRW